MITKGSVEYYKIKISLWLAAIMTTIALVAVGFAVFFAVSSNNAQKNLVMSLNDTQLPQVEYINGVDYTKTITIPTFEYQTLYPDMYVESEEKTVAGTTDKPVVYLTFDDGPSLNTATVLDTLKKYEIKATFFVVNNDIANQQYLYKRITDEGHTLGIHTYTHQYFKIYESVESYLEDFYKMFKKVYDLTGVKPTVFRFPGGSINTYNKGLYQEIIAEMLRRGFTYYDWNVSSGDAGQNFSAASIQSAVTAGIGQKSKSIVLMHDSSTKHATAAALPAIIESLKETHEFRAITNDVSPTVFTYLDNERQGAG